MRRQSNRPPHFVLQAESKHPEGERPKRGPQNGGAVERVDALPEGFKVFHGAEVVGG